MGDQRHGTPALRVRDVVPAALCVVLLLGVAGCMGAMGGGPLETAPVSGAPTAGVTPEPSPSIVVSAPPGASPEATPEWLSGYVDQLSESKRARKAPEAFTNRKPLLSCGEFVLGHGAQVPDEAWDCLAAGADAGAELVEVYPTIEGDPIINYYRVGPDIDGVEYFVDSTYDNFGSGEWEHLVCELGPGPGSAIVGDCPWDDAE